MINNHREKYINKLKDKFISLYLQGKIQVNIKKECNISFSYFNHWLVYMNKIFSIQNNNYYYLNNNLLKLKKENKNLKFKNEILKQLLLIFIKN